MARSNRQLTQFAVDKLRQYIIYGPDNFKNEKAGNTEVILNRCDECTGASVSIKLFGKEILRLVTNPFHPTVFLGVGVFAGDFYDSKGRPSRTTRERLNGLLDALGYACFIPEGVRVFIGEDESCYIGKGDCCRYFDVSDPKMFILCNKSKLIFS